MSDTEQEYGVPLLPSSPGGDVDNGEADLSAEVYDEYDESERGEADSSDQQQQHQQQYSDAHHTHNNNNNNNTDEELEGQALLDVIDSLNADALRVQLKARGLDSTGLRSALYNRLKEYVSNNELNTRIAVTPPANNEPAARTSRFTNASSNSNSTPVLRGPPPPQAVLSAAGGGGESTKLFVGQLAFDTNEEQFRQIFSSFGSVGEVVILKDQRTGRSKGCGFATLNSREAALAAIEHLHEKYTVPGAKRTLIVRLAGAEGKEQARREQQAAMQSSQYMTEKGDFKLFVGMLDHSSSEQDVRNIFSVFGEVLEVYLMRDASGESKGSGFVRFQHFNEALNAINTLHEKARDKNAPSMLRVKFADKPAGQQQPQPQRQQQPQQSMQQQGMMHGNAMGNARMGGGFSATPNNFMQQQYLQQQQMGLGMGMPGMMGNTGMGGGDFGSFMNQGFGAGQFGGGAGMQMGGGGAIGSKAKGPPGANLFVYNVPDQYSEADLLQLFSNFGNVISTNINRDLRTGQTKGFGFVSFDNPQSAALAIQSLDGFVIGNKRLNVRLKTDNDRGGGQQGMTGPQGMGGGYSRPRPY